MHLRTLVATLSTLAFAGVGASLVAPAALAAPAVDQNLGSWTDDYNDNSAIEQALSSGLKHDPFAQLVTLATDAASGVLVSTAITPASFEGWSKVYLKYSATSVTGADPDLAVALTDAAGTHVFAVPIVPSDDPAFNGMADVSAFSATALPTARLRFALKERVVANPNDPQNPIRIKPTVQAARLTWKPLSVVRLGVEGATNGCSNQQLAYKLRVSVSYVAAKNLVAFARVPTPVVDQFGRTYPMGFVSATQGGAYTDAEITVQGVTIPARSVYWQLGNINAGNTFTTSFVLQPPVGTLEGTTYNLTPGGDAENSNGVTINGATAQVATVVHSTPAPFIHKSAVGTFWIFNSAYIDGGKTLGYSLYFGNYESVPQTCTGNFHKTVVWDDVSDLVAPVEPGWASGSVFTTPPGIQLTANEGGTFTALGTNIYGITIPKNAIYWVVDTLEVGQRKTFSYSVKLKDDAKHGGPLPLGHQIDNTAHIASGFQPQTTASSAKVLIGIPNNPQGMYAKGDKIRGAAGISAQNNDNAYASVGYGDPITFLMYAQDGGASALANTLMLDKVPAGTTFSSAFLPAGSGTVFYNTTGGANATNNPPGANVAAGTLDNSWTTVLPADPTSVKWVAYRVTKLASNFFPEAGIPNNVTGELTVTVDMPANGCPLATITNRGLFQTYAYIGVGDTQTTNITGITGWVVDDEAVQVKPVVPSFELSNAFVSPQVQRNAGQVNLTMYLVNQQSGGVETDTALDASVVLTLPRVPINGVMQALPFVAVDAAGGTVDYTGLPNTLTISWASIPPGASRPVTVTVDVPKGFIVGQTFSLIANAAAHDDVCGPIAVQKSGAGSLDGDPYLQVTKRTDLAVAAPGAPVQYTLSYVNVGDAVATESWIVDRIPEGTEFSATDIPANGEVWFSDRNEPALPASLLDMTGPLIRANFIKGTVSAGHAYPPGSLATPTYIAFLVDNKTLTPAQLKSGGLASVHWTATIINDGALAGQTIRNAAAILSKELDPAVSNDALTLVSPNPSLEVNRSCPDVVGSLEEFTYTIDYVNNSTNPDYAVVITDTLPAFVQYVSATHTWNDAALDNHGAVEVPVSISGKKLTFKPTHALDATDQTALAPHEGGHLEIHGRIVAGTVSGTFADIGGTAVANNQENNNPISLATGCRVLVENADIFVRKAVDQVAPVAGETVTYTLVVSNDGGNDADDVVVEDTLPTGLTYVANSARVTTGGWSFPVAHSEPTSAAVAGGTKLRWGKDFGNALTKSGDVAGHFPGHSGDVAISFQAKVGAAVLPETTLRNALHATTPTGQDPTKPDDAFVDVRTPDPDPYVVKSGPSFAQPGQSITYRLRYGNLSRQASGPLLIVDKLHDAPVTDGVVDVTLIGATATNGETIYYNAASLAAAEPAFDPANPSASGWSTTTAGLAAPPQWVAFYRPSLAGSSGPFSIYVDVALRTPSNGLTPLPGATILNQASVHFVGPNAPADQDPSNNTSSVTTKTPGVDIGLTLTCDPVGAYPGTLPGAPASLVLELKNNGTVTAYGLHLDYTLPDWFTKLDDDATTIQVVGAGGAAATLVDATGAPINDTVAWGVSGQSYFVGATDSSAARWYKKVGLPADARVRVTVHGEVKNNIQSGTTVAQTAHAGIDYRFDFVEGVDEREKLETNNDDTCQTTVYRADPVIVKTATGAGQKAPPLTAGDRIQYSVAYNNAGAASADGVVIEDDLPENAPYVVGSFTDQPAGSTLEFDDGSGAWTYYPSGPNGTTDPNVRALRLRFAGAMPAPAGSTFVQDTGVDFRHGTLQGTRIEGGSVELDPASGGIGTYATPAIPAADQGNVVSWDRIVVNKRLLQDDATFTIDVVDADTGAVLAAGLVPDASGAIPLSLNPAQVRHIKLRGNFAGPPAGCTDPWTPHPLDSATPIAITGYPLACDHGDTYMMANWDPVYGEKFATSLAMLERKLDGTLTSTALPMGNYAFVLPRATIRSQLVFGFVYDAANQGGYAVWRNTPQGWVIEDVQFDAANGYWSLFGPNVDGSAIFGTHDVPGDQYTSDIVVWEPGATAGDPWQAQALPRPAGTDRCEFRDGSLADVVFGSCTGVDQFDYVTWHRTASGWAGPDPFPTSDETLAGFPRWQLGDGTFIGNGNVNGRQRPVIWTPDGEGGYAMSALPIPPQFAAYDFGFVKASDTHVLFNTWDEVSTKLVVATRDAQGAWQIVDIGAGPGKVLWFEADGRVLMRISSEATPDAFVLYAPDIDGTYATTELVAPTTTLSMPDGSINEASIWPVRANNGDLVWELAWNNGDVPAPLAIAHFAKDGAGRWVVQSRQLGQTSPDGTPEIFEFDVPTDSYGERSSDGRHLAWSGNCGGYLGGTPSSDASLLWPDAGATAAPLTPVALSVGSRHLASMSNEAFDYFAGVSYGGSSGQKVKLLQASQALETPTIWRPDADKILKPYALPLPEGMQPMGGQGRIAIYNGTFILGVISPDGRYVLGSLGVIIGGEQTAVMAFVWEWNGTGYTVLGPPPHAPEQVQLAQPGALTIDHAPLAAYAASGGIKIIHGEVAAQGGKAAIDSVIRRVGYYTWFWSPTVEGGFVAATDLFQDDKIMAIPSFGGKDFTVVDTSSTDPKQEIRVRQTYVVGVDELAPLGLVPFALTAPEGADPSSVQVVNVDPSGRLVGSAVDARSIDGTPRPVLWVRTDTASWSPRWVSDDASDTGDAEVIATTGWEDTGWPLILTVPSSLAVASPADPKGEIDLGAAGAGYTPPTTPPSVLFVPDASGQYTAATFPYEVGGYFEVYGGSSWLGLDNGLGVGAVRGAVETALKINRIGNGQTLAYGNGMAQGVVGGTLTAPDGTMRPAYMRHDGATWTPIVLPAPETDYATVFMVGAGPVFYGIHWPMDQGTTPLGGKLCAWTLHDGVATLADLQPYGNITGNGFSFDSTWGYPYTTGPAGIAGVPTVSDIGTLDGEATLYQPFFGGQGGLASHVVTFTGETQITPVTLPTTPLILGTGGNRPWVLGCRGEASVALDRWQVLYRTDKNPSFDFQLAVPDVCQASITNTAAITTTSPEVTTANNTSTVTTPIESADLALTLVPSSATAIQDDFVQYVATVTNRGAGTARNVVLTLRIPNGDGVSDGTVLTYRVGTLAPGASDEYDGSIYITTNVPYLPLVANASVVADSIDCVDANDTASATVVTGNLPNLWVSVESDPTTPAGEVAGFDISACNNGNADATNNQIDVTFPAGPAGAGNAASTAFIAQNGTYDALEPTCDLVGPGHFVCSVAMIPPCDRNGLAPLVIHVSIPAACDAVGSTPRVAASVTTDLDVNVSDNDDAAASVITTPVLVGAIDVVPDRATVQTGELVTWFVHFRNTGTKAYERFGLAIPVPDGTSISAAMVPTGATLKEGVLTFAVANLGPGETGSWSFTTKVDAAVGASLTAVVGTDMDNDGCGTRATSEVVTVVAPSLEITKEASASAACDAPIAWRLTVSNRGSVARTNLVVTDKTSGDSPYVNRSIRGRGASQAAAPLLSWQLGTLAPGESVTLGYQTQAPSSTGKLVANVAKVEANGELVAHSATTLVRAQCNTALRLTKSLTQSCAVANDTIGYTLVVENGSTQPIKNVVVEDYLQGGLTFVSADGGMALAAPGARVLKATVSTLGVGARAVFNVTAKIDASPGTFTFNVANASADKVPSQASNAVVTVIRDCDDHNACTADACDLQTMDGCTHKLQTKPGVADDHCDGVDNDCDGKFDEDFVGAQTTCGIGACGNTGHLVCPSGATAPSDDCKPKSALSETDATCDNIDDDCSGAADEDYVGAPTTCGEGACAATGHMGCANGNRESVCTPGAPTPEVCDGLDNDCNGKTDAADANLQPALCDAQGGVCAGATHPPSDCSEGVWTACKAATYLGHDPRYSASDATCNGLDNDCDGATDEDFEGKTVTCGRGDCQGSAPEFCLNGKVGSDCAPKPDGTTCNDQNPCSDTSACVSGACLPSRYLACDDDNVCTTDSCDPVKGCQHAPTEDGLACDDHNACTSADHCTTGACSGTSAACAEPDACHATGVCNPATGVCDYALKAGDLPYPIALADVGTLGGKTSHATAINAAGTVVGAAATATGDVHAFAWSEAGGIVDLTPIADTTSEAVAVDPSGTIVGVQTIGGVASAFSWTKGLGLVVLFTGADPAVIGLSPSGFGAGQAGGKAYSFKAGVATELTGAGVTAITPTAVNDVGAVVGQATFAGKVHAFYWTQAGGLVNVGTGDSSEAIGVSSAGMVAGSATTAGVRHAYVFRASGLNTDLGTLGGNDSFATAINTTGTVIGVSTTASGETHAFVWSLGGGLVDLGALPGGTSSAALLTATGLIAGSGASGLGTTQALVWSAAGVLTAVDLAGALAAHPVALNDAGQLAGELTTLGGAGRAFFWDARRGTEDLGTFGGATASPAAIAPNGRIVGAAATATGDLHGFVSAAPEYVCVFCETDEAPPVIACPVATEAFECIDGGHAVTLGAPSVSDACGRPVTVTNDALETYPVGATDVTFVALDEAGNRAACSTTVVVEDTHAPTLDCPPTLKVDAPTGQCEAMVDLHASASDACDGTAVPVTGPGGSAASAIKLPAGTTELTLTATDRAGNTAECKTQVEVRYEADFHIACEADLEVEAPADVCGYPEALTADVVDACNLVATVTSDSDEFPLGFSDVSFAASNAAGANASCTTHLTVIDVTPPIIDCRVPATPPTLPTVFTPAVADACGATLLVGEARCMVANPDGSESMVRDGCDIHVEDEVSVVVDSVPLGTVRIVWTATATDESGNADATECESLVDNSLLDHDKDTVPDPLDNCPLTANTDQRDTNGDGVGDACDLAPFDGLQALGAGGGCSTGGTSALWLLAGVGFVAMRRRTRARHN